MLATRLTAWLRPALTVAATAAMLALTACGGGSGAPNNPYEPPPVTPGPLTVVPGAATAFAGTPVVLSIGGGTPPYSFTASLPPASPTADLLPPGITLSASGLLSGTTTSTGVYSLVIRAQDAVGQSFARTR